MGLQLKHVLENGIVGNYWRISDIFINMDKSYSRVSLSLYKNVDSRNDNKPPILTNTIELVNDNFPFSLEAMDKENIYKIAYNAIKKPKYEVLSTFNTESLSIEITLDEYGEPIIEQTNPFYEALDIYSISILDFDNFPTTGKP